MSTPAEEETENGDAIVQTALSTISSYKKNGGGSKMGWIIALIAGILSVVAVAVVYFQLWKKGKQLAKLKHERDVLRERELAAVAESHIAANTDLMIEAMNEADQARDRQVELAVESNSLLDESRKKRDLIESLVTWEDVDLYIRK